MLHSFSWQTPAFLWPTNLQGHTQLENSQTNKQTNKQKQGQKQKATSKTTKTQNNRKKRQSLHASLFYHVAESTSGQDEANHSF